MSAMSYNGAAIIGALFVLVFFLVFFFFPFSVVVSLRRRNAAFVLSLFLREIALCHHRTLSHQNNKSLSVCVCALLDYAVCTSDDACFLCAAAARFE